MINLVIKQRIILAHIDGMSNRAIANMLHLSKDTVNKYVNEYDEKRDELLRIHPDMDASEIIQSFIEKPTYDTSNRVPSKATPELLDAIEQRFPGTVVNGELQRKELGKRVFADPAELEALNAITHPRVKESVLDMLPPFPELIAIDAIGLFEGGLAELCDITVAITAPVEDRIQRLMDREGISREYAQSRIAAQRSNAEFSKMCDYTLENDASQEDFQRKCLAFFGSPAIMKEKP